MVWQSSKPSNWLNPNSGDRVTRGRERYTFSSETNHQLPYSLHHTKEKKNSRAQIAYSNPTKAKADRRKRENVGGEVWRGKSKDLKLASPTLQGTDWTQMAVSGSELRTWSQGKELPCRAKRERQRYVIKTCRERGREREKTKKKNGNDKKKYQMRWFIQNLSKKKKNHKKQRERKRGWYWCKRVYEITYILPDMWMNFQT